MRNKQELIKVIENNVLEPYKGFVVNEVKPSIRLKTTGNESIELGQTKLGGCPDLPEGSVWEKSDYKNSYLSFLGQVNLSEVKDFDELNLLPKNGILYFYFNLDSGDDGKVVFIENPKNLRKSIPPHEFNEEKKPLLKRLFTRKKKKTILKESIVEIYKDYSFPSWDSLALDQIQKKAKTDIRPVDAFLEGAFEEIYDQNETETTSNHHLIGLYQGIQHEYHESSFYEVEEDYFVDPEYNMTKKALEWKLLFQFDSDVNLDISIGDWGRIFFFIHQNDLKNQKFDNINFAVDCY